MTRAEFLKELQEENAGWEALLGQIGEDRMESGIQEGGWTVKDIVAHMTGWRKRTVSRLQAALNHQAVPPPPWPANLHSLVVCMVLKGYVVQKYTIQRTRNPQRNDELFSTASRLYVHAKELSRRGDYLINSRPVLTPFVPEIDVQGRGTSCR